MLCEYTNKRKNNPHITKNLNATTTISGETDRKTNKPTKKLVQTTTTSTVT